MTPTTNEPPVPAPETASATLTVTHLHGALAGRRQLIHRFPALIGRSHRCEVQLDPNDTKASGRHAQLVFDGQTFWIEDLGSTNGTRLNGRPITRAALTSGDDIEFGPGGPRLRVTFDLPTERWIGNVGGETYYLGVCEFPLRSAWRFPAYAAGGLCLLLPLWLDSVVAAVLLIPVGLLALLLGWGLTRVNITITPLHLEYQGLWRQVTLPWSEVTHLYVNLQGADGRRADYTVVGRRQTVTFRPTSYVGGIELARLIVRRTGKRWTPPPGKN
ncbi:MAG: FHA domain-containing protein [Chloracidobacterium sp.]|nr:FHA domain-containing protein [Chloracidobacterium sp.]MDW8216748.1 FHA domain-containing protein [Acidobacteriota bacterium]